MNTPSLSSAPLADVSAHAPLLEHALCELCGRPPTDTVLATRDLGWRKPGEFNLVRCEQCNLIITTPRPVPASMPVYYEDWYNFAPLEEVRREMAESLPNRYICRTRLHTLESTGPLTPGMKVLDVGAGFGVQLDYCIRHRQIAATAIDFDPTTVDHSLVKGRAELRTGDLLDANFPAESFDVVTLHETLEHVYRPKATLDEAFRILKPGGRLVVEVPDYGSPLRRLFGRFWFAVMVPVHLHHFTKDSLNRVVTSAGFKPLRHLSMFVPFEASASLLAVYATLTGASFYDVSRPERVLSLRGMVHLPFAAFLFAFLFLVDLPLQAVMWLLGSTGVQTLIAVKPAPPDERSQAQPAATIGQECR